MGRLHLLRPDRGDDPALVAQFAGDAHTGTSQPELDSTAPGRGALCWPTAIALYEPRPEWISGLRPAWQIALCQLDA